MNGCPAKISTCERLSFNPLLFWKVKKAKGKRGQMTSHIPEQSQVPGRAGLTFFPPSKSHLATGSRSISKDLFVPVQRASSSSLLSLEQKTGKEWSASEELGMCGVDERSTSVWYFETCG